MKKYLMTGIAALALCVGFTSCSHDVEQLSQEEITELKAQQVVLDYQKAFVATFGQPAANHKWGFVNYSAMARTRYGNTGDTYAATHQYTSDGQAFEEGQTVTGTVIAGANMNHNEWADPDKEFGGWVVPPALTKEQKDLVARYFQTVDDMSFEDPHLRHFFVQQVYKGGKVDAGKVNNTTEGITAANGSKYDSDNMNLLTVGHYNSHINDFNAGTCSESDVLDNNQKVGGTSHKDQITLMVNVDDTSCFGYHETGSSTHHNDKAALVSWETISKWAGIYGTENDILNDGWDRSFLGFDLAIKEGADAYATDNAGNVLYADYSQAPASPAYAWDGENIIPIKQITKIQHEGWVEQQIGGYLDEYKNIMKGTEAIGWLTTNENFYVAADKVIFTREASAGEKLISEVYSDNVLVFKDVKVVGAQNNKADVLNLKRIQELVSQGYLPVNNKSLTEWVQVGTSDGYYSDWIVTLTEAKRQTAPVWDLRIIAEDLNAQAQAGDTEDSDWDFNDVVLDVKFLGDDNVRIRVTAAGATLPIRINGEDALEVHGLYGKPTNIMINTGAAAAGYPAQAYENKYPAAATFERNISGVDASYGANIKIEVQKNVNGEDKWLELTAKAGEPAAKMGVLPDYTYCPERTDIRTMYSGFVAWVTKQNTVYWWRQ